MRLAFKTILVATDFGEAAQLALEYGRVIANRFGAGLRVLHVVDAPTVMGSELDVPDVGLNNEQALQDAHCRLAETLLEVTGNDVIGLVLVGHAPAKIVEYACDHDVDLIVMGTHGRRALAHLMMGSVAELVVRTAPCPVFTVREIKSPQSVSVEEEYAAVWL
jgi:nucleotide-binding universal stress UspA family protein